MHMQGKTIKNEKIN